MKLKALWMALASVSLLAGCTKKTDELLVGEFGSMTGSEATFGQSTHKGIELAFEEINAAGGIKGKKLKLISLDDAGKSEEAASAVTRLITQNKVIALLGEVASGRSLAAAPIAQKNKIPMVSPSSTNPKVTEVGDYIFRVCFIDPFQGTVMAKFTVDTLKKKKVAILRDVKSDYSVGLADYYVLKMKELGGEIVMDKSYQGGDMDFKAQLTEIKSKEPEAIFIPGYYTEVGLIARQARELGIKADLLGGDGWDSSKLYEIGKDAINGGYFSNHYTSESKDPVLVDFVNKFKAKYGEVPDGMAGTGYDAAKILAKAMMATSEVTSEQIREQLTKIKDHAGVTGKISMNEKRDATKSAVVVQVNGTTNKYITTVEP